MSATKYLRLEDRLAIIASLNTRQHRPKGGLKACQWCQDIIDDPPQDFILALAYGSKVVFEAVKAENDVDLHTAQLLCLILPLFHSGSPDRSTEDSLVHNYLSQTLLSIFSRDSRFKIKWANRDLKKGSKFKPDFLVYTMSINVKCLLVVGEFKHSSSYSQIESDVVKLGKQMRTIYNELVFHHITHPVVCGIICQGDDIFVMVQITYFSIMQIEAFIFIYSGIYNSTLTGIEP